MMKALIIDDERKARTLLRVLLEEHCKEIHDIEEASDLEEGISCIKKQQPNIVFLDIEMPKYSGLQILDFFEPEDIDFQIIFVTAYNSYAIEAFKLSASDYLLKPLDVPELKAAVQKATKTINDTNLNAKFEELKKAFHQLSLNKIALEIPKGIIFIAHDDIMLFEADGMYTKVYMKSGEVELICKPLKHFVTQLSEKSLFYKPHRSYLVNLKFVKELTKKDGFYLVLENNKTVPIAKDKKEEFIRIVNEVF